MQAPAPPVYEARPALWCPGMVYCPMMYCHDEPLWYAAVMYCHGMLRFITPNRPGGPCSGRD